MNEYLALGNALHLALELAHKKGPFDANEAHRLYTAEFNRLIEEEEIFVNYPKRKKLEAEGAQMIALYATQVERGLVDPEPLGHEIEFKIPYNGIYIVGRIDKVETDPDTLEYIITDYKSGSKEPDEWFLNHNLQFTAYAWACQHLYGVLPRRLYWHHLRTGKRLETVRTQDDIDNLKRMIDNAILMDKMEIRHRIYHEQVCGWCDYKGAICDDKELEERVVNQRGKRKSKGSDSN